MLPKRIIGERDNWCVGRPRTLTTYRLKFYLSALLARYTVGGRMLRYDEWFDKGVKITKDTGKKYCSPITQNFLWGTITKNYLNNPKRSYLNCCTG